MAAQNLPRIKKTRIAVHTIPPLENYWSIENNIRYKSVEYMDLQNTSQSN